MSINFETELTNKYGGLILAPWIDTFTKVDLVTADPRNEPLDENFRAHERRAVWICIFVSAGHLVAEGSE